MQKTTQGNHTIATWYSWGDYLKDLDDSSRKGSTRASHNTRKPEWHGSATYEDSRVLAGKGWDEPLPTVERIAGIVEDRVEAQILTTGFQATYGVAGSEVDIGVFLSGEPECMIESTPIRVSRHGRAVRLAIGASFLGHVEPEDVIRRGAAVVALADILAKAQHPIEIWWVNTAEGQGTFTQQVRVQAADDPLDIPRLLYCFAHPSAQRRQAFRGREAFMGWAGGMGGTQDIAAELLPDQAENTVVLQPLHPREHWTDDEISAWVIEQVEAIFD